MERLGTAGVLSYANSDSWSNPENHYLGRVSALKRLTSMSLRE